jgi:hypothetical protein
MDCRRSALAMPPSSLSDLELGPWY